MKAYPYRLNVLSAKVNFDLTGVSSKRSGRSNLIPLNKTMSTHYFTFLKGEVWILFC